MTAAYSVADGAQPVAKRKRWLFLSIIALIVVILVGGSIGLTVYSQNPRYHNTSFGLSLRYPRNDKLRITTNNDAGDQLSIMPTSNTPVVSKALTFYVTKNPVYHSANASFKLLQQNCKVGVVKNNSGGQTSITVVSASYTAKFINGHTTAQCQKTIKTVDNLVGQSQATSSYNLEVQYYAPPDLVYDLKIAVPGTLSAAQHKAIQQLVGSVKPL